MMYKHLILPVIAIAFTAGMFACKKKSNNNPFGSERISVAEVAHNGAIQHYQFYYSDAGLLDSMIETGLGSAAGHNGYKKFNYGSSSYVITDETNFAYTVYVNANNQITKVMIADTITMLYNGTQLGEINVRATTSTSPFYQIISTNVYWQGGDIYQTSTNGVVVNISYDVSKNGQPGDPSRMIDFLRFGRSIAKTTHMPKEETKSGVWTEQYYYQFDTKGRINELIRVRNNNGVSADDSTFFSYQYY